MDQLSRNMISDIYNSRIVNSEQHNISNKNMLKIIKMRDKSKQYDLIKSLKLIRKHKTLLRLDKTILNILDLCIRYLKLDKLNKKPIQPIIMAYDNYQQILLLYNNTAHMLSKPILSNIFMDKQYRQYTSDRVSEYIYDVCRIAPYKPFTSYETLTMMLIRHLLTIRVGKDKPKNKTIDPYYINLIYTITYNNSLCKQIVSETLKLIDAYKTLNRLSRIL